MPVAAAAPGSPLSHCRPTRPLSLLPLASLPKHTARSPAPGPPRARPQPSPAPTPPALSRPEPRARSSAPAPARPTARCPCRQDAATRCRAQPDAPSRQHPPSAALGTPPALGARPCVTPGFKEQSRVHLIHAPKKTTYIITECIEINVTI
jgi:hypothetical protein